MNAVRRKKSEPRKKNGPKAGKPRDRGRVADRQISYARLLGLILAAAGFAAIGLGWAGAARRACVDCQIPYIISGGAAGVALVVFGAALLLMAQVRAEGRRLASRIEVAAAIGRAGVGGPNGQPDEGERSDQESAGTTGIMIVEGGVQPVEVDTGPAA